MPMYRPNRPIGGGYTPTYGGFGASRSGWNKKTIRSESGGDPVPTRPASSMAFGRLAGFGGRVGVQDPMQNANFVQRRLRAMAGVNRGAEDAANQFSRSTGLSYGTTGGAAQRSALRALGAAQAYGVGDEMYKGERDYLTGLEHANEDRALSALGALVGAENSRNALSAAANQFNSQLDEQQYQFDYENPPDDFDENDFIPYDDNPGSRPLMPGYVTFRGYRPR